MQCVETICCCYTSKPASVHHQPSCHHAALLALLSLHSRRYKWDAIRSLVKSVSGLQARKLQELQIPTFNSEPPDTLELRASSGFRAGLLSLLKGRKPAGGRMRLHGGDAGLDEAELGGLREGSAGGEDGSSTAGDGVLGGGSDYLDLMRDALRAKHKQKKVALLLGNVPPPPPPTAAAAAVLAA
jgi:hypothetical protein